MDESLENSIPCISAITEIELLCWKTTNEKDLKMLHNFINDAMVIELENVTRKSAQSHLNILYKSQLSTYQIYS